MTSLTSFITTLEGKRCTAVPKQGANTAKPNGNVGTTTTSESLAQFTTTAETSTAVAEEGSSTSTASSSTSLSLTTFTTSTASTTSESTSISTSQQVEATPIVPPAAVLATSSPEPPPSSSSSAPPAPTTTSIPPSTEIITTTLQPPPPPTSQAQAQSQSQSQADSQSAITLSSQTNTIQAAPTIEAQPEATPTTQPGTALPDVTSSPALPDVTSSPALPDSTTPPPVLFTTIGTAAASSDAPAAQASGSTSSTNGAVSAVPASPNSAIQSTVAIAGGVIGGILAMSMIAFFVWFWRRRQLKKRRSTLLTPLTIDGNGNPSFGPGDEKGPYVINRGSIGPTPRAERFKAALGYNMRKIHGSVSRIVARGSRGTSVNMNRGTSQFMESTPPRNRADSASSGTGYPTGSGADVSTKDRLMDWWTSFKADMSFNWRLRNTKTPNPTEPFTSISSRSMTEKPTANPSSTTQQPDFLTLLSMDDRELDREAQRRRVAKNTGSASSSDRFLGGLNLDFATDPFADSNAIAHISAKPAPLAINPFSDTNANPNTYVAEMRRSRGQSVSRVPSTVYRDSVESFGIRRNKFRSDPFDLEPLRAQGSVSSTGGTVGSMSGVARPAGAHVRSESFTSKYSSGISLGDWSDPGPDVGPAAERGERESPTKGWRERQDRRSGGSQGSVGKAM